MLLPEFDYATFVKDADGDREPVYVNGDVTVVDLDRSELKDLGDAIADKIERALASTKLPRDIRLRVAVALVVGGAPPKPQAPPEPQAPLEPQAPPEAGG